MLKRSLLKILAPILVGAISFSLVGCGGSETKQYDETGTVPENFTEYNNILEDGQYYVKSKNGEYSKLYLGETTFEPGKSSTDEDFTKIVWFKEDFDKIPTLYKGDSLISYNSQILEEKFIFERYYDYGYSIGLRNLVLTPSGRYSISTKEEDEESGTPKIIAYPDGDTSEIVNYTNDIVILESLGGIKLRGAKEEDENNEDGFNENNDISTNENSQNPNKEDNTSPLLNKAGTLSGLQKDAKYKAEIYEGTVRHEHTFTADVRILGKFEYFYSCDYEFESETIMNITIPEDWVSGYYLINGIGMFRYVAGDSYDDNTDFNAPNPSFEKNKEEYGDSEDEINISYGNTNNGTKTPTVNYTINKEDNVNSTSTTKENEYYAEFDLEEITKYKDIASKNKETNNVIKKVNVSSSGANVCYIKLDKAYNNLNISIKNKYNGFSFNQSANNKNCYECTFPVGENEKGEYSIVFPKEIKSENIKGITVKTVK